MKDFIRDMLDQTWTLLGMFIAWLVLDGSARTIVGYAIIWSTFIWVATYRIRNPKEDNEEVEETEPEIKTTKRGK
jgi:hypothetical protein